MKNITHKLLGSTLMITLFAACSRPVAYFQPSARENFATTQPKAAPVTAAETTAPTISAMPAEPVAKASAALDQMDALVRNDSKLSANKTTQKRLSRVRTLLAAASAKASLSPTEVTAPRKMNLVERMMLKKMNRKINRELAPANPNKPMANTGVLAAGAVLVIVGLVLIIAGSSSTVGVILLLAGAVILLVGLL